MFFNYYFIHIINKSNMSRSRLDWFYTAKKGKMLEINHLKKWTSKFWFIFQNLTREFIDDVISVIPSEICRYRRLTNAAKHCLNENGEQKIRQEFASLCCY